ncbi:MAG: 2OG-Fe(II) oxygenase [Rhodopila sp.]|nr:2OG-Fe(II) oxygenase [Rhodopila sp.]
MSSIATDLAEALSTVRRPGAFFVAGTEEMRAPGLAVEGIGPIALPLLPVQAEQLIAAAERAPYGRGADTLTDVTVRRTWQIRAERVRIEGKHWPATLQAIVTRIAEGLGVTDPVEADLYKLLVYDKGSFFLPHRDTEKAAGMFATLVLALPSVSEGGELIVRHRDQEARLPLTSDDPSDVAFAAFYADCVHEVLPVNAGYRLVLIYNLLRRGPGRLPEAPDYDSEREAVATLLKNWAEAPRSPEDAEPEKIVLPLEHAYTPAELGFATLKGADAGIAQVVVAAARHAGCEVHLALVSIEESGIAEYTGGYFRSHRRWSGDEDDEDDAFEIVEVSERAVSAAHWRRPDGDPSPLTVIPVEEDEFSPPEAFDDLEPDEQHFHEATGNEGASFERTYSRAALILWPRDRLLAVINQGGLKVTLPFLEDLADRWAAGGDASVWDQAHDLSGHMISAWPVDQWQPYQDKERTSAGRVLHLLVRLGDAARLEAMLTAIAACHGFDNGDCSDIVEALCHLPPERAASLAKHLVEETAEVALDACGNLLARASAVDPAVVTGAARALVAALPGDPSRASSQPPWRRGPGVRPEFIADLFTALGRIDAALAGVAADHILEWPRTYDFDTILVPAVLTLLATPDTGGLAAVRRLRVACAAHLDGRIALPLEAPRDWRRDNTLGCGCKHCRALGLYLDDPTQKIWVFRAVEADRSHVEGTIRTAHCDLDTTTERRSRPYSLICTKNQASYERRRVQRERDLADRERLDA